MRFTDCIVITGESCKKFDGNKNYISTGAVDEDHIDQSQIESVSYDLKPSRANLMTDDQSILFAKMQDTKKILLINECLKENVYSTGFFSVAPKNNILNKECLYHLLGSKTFLNQKDKYCSGATQKAITLDGLNKIEINIPKFEEQNQIAKRLDVIKRILDSYDSILKKYDNLIKARFIEVFGDISVNDKKWEGHPLGELCTIVRGGSPRPIERYLGGDVPWIKIGDATDEENIYLHSTKEHIIADGVKKSRLVKAGSLIFANCGVSLGFARIITFDGCIHDGWLAMENIDTRLDKVFLLQTLNQMTDHFREIAPAGTQPNLNTTIMKAYLQIVPPMELQQEFISFVKQVDKSKFHCFFVNKNDIRRYRLNLTIQFMNHI